MSFTTRLSLIIPGTILSMLSVTLLLLRLASGFVFSSAVLNSSSAAINQASQTNFAASSAQDFSNPANCEVSAKYPDRILRWCGFITNYAQKHGLSPDLVAALIWQESGGNPEAYSKSGAVGLMQVMPRDGIASSFMCVNGPCFQGRPSTEELRDPEFNVAYGTRYLASLLNKKGNLREALKSYGPMNVNYYYADKVLSIYQAHKG